MQPVRKKCVGFMIIFGKDERAKFKNIKADCLIQYNERWYKHGQEDESMKRIKDILFPKKIAPVRLAGFRLFNVGGRIRWFRDLLKR